jgi:beta-galactosidase
MIPSCGWGRSARPLGAVLAALGLLVALSGAPLRPRQPLERGWRFQLGEFAGAAEAVAASAQWPEVAVPHTWNARDGADGGEDYRRATGWYVRAFTLDRSWKGRRVLAQFDAASRRAEVFVNGRSVGSHLGGYARFRIDVTDALREGENVLAVRVSNASDDTPPLSADYTFFGGLYRGVSLFALHPVHLEANDHGADALYLQQERVTAEQAELVARVRVRNEQAAPAAARLRLELKDATGAVVTAAERETRLDSGAALDVALPLIVPRPHLWQGRADPYRYTATATLHVGDEITDELSVPVGLRSFRVDPRRGFFLNEQPLDLHGASRHQDRAGKGWAISTADEREDFAFLRELGATALRVAHYPQSDLWFDLADEAGLVVWAEIPVVNEVSSAPGYADNAAQQLRELIRQHFNHPSICFWGVGNETREVGDKPGRETPNAPTADRLLAQLDALARREDPTRLTTYASHHRPDDVRNFHTQVLAFNKYQGWYGGRADDLAGWLDSFHAKHPETPVGISEYGAGANVAQHDLALTPPKPGGPWHPEEYQAFLHERQWFAMAARPYVWCKFIWNLFDFASDGRAEGEQPGINDKGLVTYDRRLRKDAFYFYKAQWSAEPVLHLASRRFVARTEPRTEVKAYSNAPQVELWLNGVSQGVRASEERICRWQVELAEGENRLAVRAATAAGELTDTCVWTLTAPKKP